MRLSTKMILASLALILIPVLILAFSLLWLSVYRPRTLSTTSGGQEELNIMNIHVIRQFDGLMSRLEEDVKKLEARDPDALLREEDLRSLSDSYRGDKAYLVAYADDFYFNGGADNEEILAFINEADPLRSGGMLYFAGLNAPDLIGSYPFSAPERDGTLYLVCDVSGSLPSLQKIIMLIAFSAFMLIAGFFILAFWMQHSLVRPVKELKRAAQEIKEGNLNYEVTTDAQDEFGELCRDFEDMRKRLKMNAEEHLQYEQDNKVLISNISHDLKTPITAIKGYVEGIRDGVASSPEKMDRYLTTIYNKAEDMDKLVEELNIYSQIDMSRIPYHFAKISVKEYFADCAEELSAELEAEDVRLEYVNEMAEDALIVGDPEQLHRVINNIVSNSVKYMDKDEKQIRIRVKDAGDCVRVEMEDNGRGIAAQDLPNIFDRFYRTDQSRSSRTGGSGIGLSIVKKIVEDHGGRIWALSRLGEGTTLCFELRKYEENT